MVFDRIPPSNLSPVNVPPTLDKASKILNEVTLYSVKYFDGLN